MRSSPMPYRVLLITLASTLWLAACGGSGDDSAPPSTSAPSSLASGPHSPDGSAESEADKADAAATEAAIEAAAAAGDDGLVPGGTERRRALATAAPQLTVRASGTMAGGVGPVMQVRVNGLVIGTVEVRQAESTSYTFPAPTLRKGVKVDVVFTNDAWIDGQDRNLYVDYLTDGATVSVLPSMPGALIDRGAGEKAFDRLDTVPGQRGIYWNGALRLTWPTTALPSPTVLARRQGAARLLLQATFGPTPADIDKVAATTPTTWLAQQMAIAARPDFVNHVQAQFARGAAYRPGGDQYSAAWVPERFWATAATSTDQLRKRVAFALHHIFMVSLADSNLYEHTRAYANYLDTLNKHAFGNYRTLLEEVALSPVMGIYLSHMRNRKEDPATGRVPDENFAREVMQLFSIGLVELNADGTPRLGSDGRALETYDNADVMALAKIFTGWSWAFPDSQLTENRFRWGWPDYRLAGDARIDLLKMKSYPGQFSTAAVQLFAGKPYAVSIPQGGTGPARLKLALDGLFKHPNVGPFIGRQLIQQLVTSHPSPAYVARVSAAFANNGRGVRGDLAAVVKAVLLDVEARRAPTPEFGKLREPVLRVTQWMRAFGARSVSGNYMLAYELDDLSQRALAAPSVFGWFRPGYIPPGTAFAARGATAPEFQIVNESTSALWVNQVEGMVGWGMGWTGTTSDVTTAFTPQVALSTSGNVEALVQNLNLLLFAGGMSPALRQDLLDAVGGVNGTDADSHLNRARIAAYVAMSSPEFLAQR
jgi:uncharacterized protein (DUF1800 family)